MAALLPEDTAFSAVSGSLPVLVRCWQRSRRPRCLIPCWLQGSDVRVRVELGTSGVPELKQASVFMPDAVCQSLAPRRAALRSVSTNAADRSLCAWRALRSA